MDIKKAGVKDIDEILDIWNNTKEIIEFTKITYDKKYYNNIAKSKNELILVAKINKQLVGTLHAKLEKNVCQVLKLTISNIFRNKGIGTKLLKEIEKLAKKKNIKKMIFQAKEENDTFKNFLNKNKYEVEQITIFSKKV